MPSGAPWNEKWQRAWLSAFHSRHFIPSLPGKKTTIISLRAFLAIRSPSAPLLEEKRHAIMLALVFNSFYPFRFHRPGLGAGFAADDHPVDAAQINFANIIQQWFNR